LRRVLLALPGHRGSILHRAHQFTWQRHVPCEKRAHVCGAGTLQHSLDLSDDDLALLDLTDDADLHVVNEESDVPRVEQFLQGSWYVQVVDSLHTWIDSTRGLAVLHTKWFVVASACSRYGARVRQRKAVRGYEDHRVRSIQTRRDLGYGQALPQGRG